ncbi:LysR family transcriptional regulator [Ruegeria marina]|uniref:Transcriptional regulator, LysR family n=1 Tax=Ruegeria marina TaxID=639004 RepID=A0A1G7F3H9_9RHOB|nr:LysR family transcriptional regulator [Ruegeria marina]SDE70457.1 transcriptional regulator, LysR family [Ruegeria marina]
MLNFTLKQLRYVEAAGRLHSIAKAAAELSISQSSITAAIDSLESWLDFDLFVRTPAKGIQPTLAGADTLELIRNFLEQARQFDAELRSVGGDTAGLVRIGCYATAAPAFLPPILRSINRDFPQMSVQVLEGNMEAIATFLDEGKADLAFTYPRVLHAGHDFLPLFQPPPFALISTDDPMSEKMSVTLKELSRKPMILLDLPLTRDYFVSLFNASDCTPHIAHSTRSAEIARALVSGGFGYTILNIRPQPYQDENARYRAVPISDASEVEWFGIATVANVRRPKIVQTFMDVCAGLQQEGAFDALSVRPQA